MAGSNKQFVDSEGIKMFLILLKKYIEEKDKNFISTIEELQNKVAELETKINGKLDKDQLLVVSNNEYESIDKSNKDCFYLIKEE